MLGNKWFIAFIVLVTLSFIVLFGVTAHAIPDHFIFYYLAGLMQGLAILFFVQFSKGYHKKLKKAKR